MTEIERNRKMFYMIADIIEMQPSLHDQRRYVTLAEGEVFNHTIIAGHEVTCGTTQCIAGWAMELDGRYDLAKAIVESNGFEPLPSEVSNPSVSSDLEYGVDSIAGEILGLDDSEAERLFHTCKMDLDWPKILRAIGDGGDVDDVITDAEAEAGYCD